MGREREEDADEGCGLGGVDGQAGGVLHHLSDAAAYLCRRLAGGEEGEIAAKVFHIIYIYGEAVVLQVVRMAGMGAVGHCTSCVSGVVVIVLLGMGGYG